MRFLLSNDDDDGDDSSPDLWWVGVILCLAGSIGLNLGNNLQSFGLQGPGGNDENGKLSEIDIKKNHLSMVSTEGETIYLDAFGSEQDDLSSCYSFDENDSDSDRGTSLDRSPTLQRLDEVESVHFDKNNSLSPSSSSSPSSPSSPSSKQKMYNQPIFIFGTVLFVSGSLLTFVAFGFAAQSLLASLEGVQFVSNMIFGKVIRNSKITCSIILGVGMICGGIATVVLNGSHASESFTSQQLMMLYVDNHAYQAFLVIAGGSAVLLRYIEKAYTKKELQGKPWPYSDVIIPLTFAIFSAIFGTQSVVQAKCLMMCITNSLDHKNQFYHPFTYAMLGAWLLFVGVWLTRMGTALKRFDPMFIIPLLQVSFILLAILSGGIFFEEFDTFGAMQTVWFCSGVLLVCIGLYFLTPKRNKKLDDRMTVGTLSETTSHQITSSQFSPLTVPDEFSKDSVTYGETSHAFSPAARSTLNRPTKKTIYHSTDGHIAAEFPPDSPRTRSRSRSSSSSDAEHPPPLPSGAILPPPPPPAPAPSPSSHHQQMRKSLNSPIQGPINARQHELPPWDSLTKEEQATRVLEEESGFYDLGLGGRGDYFNVDLLSQQFGKKIQTAAMLAGEAAATVGEVFVDDLRDITETSLGTVNFVTQFTSHVVEEPEATIEAAGRTMTGAVGSVGGWLRTRTNGEVDWRATTAQLNLIAAAQAQESAREKKKRLRRQQREQKKLQQEKLQQQQHLPGSSTKFIKKHKSPTSGYRQVHNSPSVSNNLRNTYIPPQLSPPSRRGLSAAENDDDDDGGGKYSPSEGDESPERRRSSISSSDYSHTDDEMPPSSLV